MEERFRRKKFIRIWSLSVASLLLIAIEQVVSAFRSELFGLDRGYAGYNFAFNFMVFLPSILISIVLSFGSLLLYHSTWMSLRATKERVTWGERLSIGPALLLLTLLAYVFIRIIWTVARS